MRLLRTKLYRPRPTGDLIHRPRVREILDRNPDRVATLVCAPAGFGKTTLLADWLEDCPRPSAWLSLDERDSDLGTFLGYFAGAVRTVFPAACSGTLALLEAPALAPIGVLANALGNDLDLLTEEADLPPGQRFMLVLDDLHLVHELAVHNLLNELLRHPPRSLHLILSTRHDPPFPLDLLRGHGELSEIRVGELRFTPEEVDAFMQQAVDATLDAETLAALTEHSEGWATGLRMAALALNASGDGAGALSGSTVDNRYVLDYLLNEVFARVPLATQDFLLKTSILDRLSGALCDAVTPPSDPQWDGRAYLEWLGKQNLFLFPLDAQGTWHRYHRLFQSLLRNQLERRYSRAEIAGLRGRASAWLAQNGHLEEAIEQALSGDDQDTAVRLVEAHRHEAMNHEHWPQLRSWLTSMPRRLVDARPELLMLEAWLLYMQWRAADLAAALDRIEALLESASLPSPDRTRLCAEIDALRSWTFFYGFDAERARTHAERALERLPYGCSLARSNAWFSYGAALQMTGDYQGAIEAFHGALREDGAHANAFPSRLYTGLCFVYWLTADLQNLLLAADRLLAVAEQRDLAEGRSWAHYFRGCALYQQNDLAAAEVEFGAVVRQRYVAHDGAFSQSAIGLASVHQARGESQKAREAADMIAAHGLETGNARIIADAAAFRALLAQQRGATAESQREAGSLDRSTLTVPMTTFQVALVSQARVWLAVGTPAELDRAASILARLRDLASASHNIRVLIEVLALEALLHEARGDRPRALGTVKEALALAEPGGLIRVFVDLGPKMAGLIAQVANGGPATEYLRLLLAAFPVAPAPRAALSRPELIEPLSQREAEVLALLAEHLSNKEIARALSIATATVKRHTVNVYQKLQVGNRREAVAKAFDLGLLPPPFYGR